MRMQDTRYRIKYFFDQLSFQKKVCVIKRRGTNKK